MTSKKLTILSLFLLGAWGVLAVAQTFAPGAEFNVHVAKARNYPFCEIFLLSGQPPDLEAQIYNTSSVGDCPPGKFDRLNVTAMAEQLKVDRVWLNPRRHWIMDQLWVSKTGAVRDFDGVKAQLMAEMKLPPGLKLADKGTESFYLPAEIHRHSKYLYLKGKEVYLLHDPEGHT